VADQILLYISAASDLERERELLNKAVTEIPVDLGWRIVQSPRGSQPLDLTAIRQADVHLLLLGGDIRAPIGQEWHTARRAGRSPVLLLKQVELRTVAALDFIRYVEQVASWQRFVDAADLRRQVLQRLGEHIWNHGERYRLTLPEIERLKAWQKELETATAVDESVRGGVGESSVLFSQERYIPSKGVLIQPKDKKAG
jgi:hypothetical protein